jgi:putative glutamine amidotransferase
MSLSPTKPLVGIPVSLRREEDRPSPHHITADSYVRTTMTGADVVPMLIPALGDSLDIDETAARLDGLMLTGGRANIEPHHYDGSPFPDDEVTDPARDATVLPLIRACIDHGIPVFGICRGIQEINVALGGSLHYRLHTLPGKLDHRMRRDLPHEQRLDLRHPISLAPGGLLAELAGTNEVMVNTLHGQGIDRLGDGLEVEALAPDGVIEAVRLTDAEAFTVGVQWHAEARHADHLLSRRLFEVFGDAARDCAARKAGRLPVT